MCFYPLNSFSTASENGILFQTAENVKYDLLLFFFFLETRLGFFEKSKWPIFINIFEIVHSENTLNYNQDDVPFSSELWKQIPSKISKLKKKKRAMSH